MFSGSPKIEPAKGRREAASGLGFRYLGTSLLRQNSSIFFLHLWKIPVISNVRTNSAGRPGNRTALGSLETNKSCSGKPGDEVARVSRLRRKT